MAPEDGIPRGVVGVLHRLDALSTQASVTLRDVMEAFDDTTYAPLLMVPALIVVSPLSGIPLLPTLLGLTIALIAVQAMVGKRHLWLPGVLMRRRVSGARLHRGIDRLGRLARWLDRHSQDRLTALVSPPLDLLPKALSGLCGAAMPFLELVPFSSSILGAAVVLFAVSLLVADGVFVLAGVATMLLGAAIPLSILGGLLAL